MMIVIDKKSYNYVVEIRYNIPSATANITNIYWNEGVVKKVYLMDEFAILLGYNAHKVILHS